MSFVWSGSFIVKMLTDGNLIETLKEKTEELVNAEEEIKFWTKEKQDIITTIKGLEKIMAPDGWNYGFVEGLGWAFYPPGFINKASTTTTTTSKKKLNCTIL